MRNWLMRRHYIVDWKLQRNLCLNGLFYGGLVLVAVTGGIFAPLLWHLSEIDPTQQDELSIVMLYLHDRIFGIVLMCALIVVFSAVKSSHRIAGPLVRYKRNLRLLATGRLPEPLRTRPGDYLQEEVACLNAAVRGVAERVDAIREAHAGVKARLRELAIDELSPEMQALAAADRELDASIAAFVEHDTGDALPLAEPMPAPEALLAGAR